MWRTLRICQMAVMAFMTVFSAASLAATTTATFDVNANVKQVFLGFGNMYWTGATTPPSVSNQSAGAIAQRLKIQNILGMAQNTNVVFIRENYELRGSGFDTSTVQNNLNYNQYLNGVIVYVQNPADPTNPNDLIPQVQYHGWVDSTDAPVDIQNPNAKYLWNASIPPSFLSNNTLISSLRDNFVWYLAAGIQRLNSRLCTGMSNCYKLDYMQLVNEPDYSPKILPADYVYIVKTLRTYLNANNIAPGTKIAGAGVAHIDDGYTKNCCWTTGTDAITNAVIADTAALLSMGAWDVHSYVWTQKSICGNSFTGYYSCGGAIENTDATSAINGYGQTSVRYFLPAWYSAPKAAASTIPFFLSELANTNLVYHGTTYGALNATKLCVAANHSDCTAMYTVPYGVRLYIDAIAALASGANSMMFWQGVDQTWDTGGLGFIDTNGNYKPAYYAMQPLFTNIPLNSTVLVSPSTQAGTDIYSVGFKGTNSLNETCVTIAMANNTKGSALSRTTTISGLGAMNLSTSTPVYTSQFIQSGSTVYNYVVNHPAVSITKKSAGVFNYTVSMPQDSTLTVQACFK